MNRAILPVLWVLAIFGEVTLGRETQPSAKPPLYTAANATFTKSGQEPVLWRDPVQLASHARIGTASVVSIPAARVDARDDFDAVEIARIIERHLKQTLEWEALVELRAIAASHVRVRAPL